jgi:hypothetical protein
MTKDNAEKTPQLLEDEKKAKELQDAEDLVNKAKKERAEKCLAEINVICAKYKCKVSGVQVQALPEASIGINVIPL